MREYIVTINGERQEHRIHARSIVEAEELAFLRWKLTNQDSLKLEEVK